MYADACHCLQPSPLRCYVPLSPQGKEEVFHFLEHVLCEVVELFPFEYIHIGGDECPKTRWMDCEHCQARIAEVWPWQVGLECQLLQARRAM